MPSPSLSSELASGPSRIGGLAVASNCWRSLWASLASSLARALSARLRWGGLPLITTPTRCTIAFLTHTEDHEPR